MMADPGRPAGEPTSSRKRAANSERPMSCSSSWQEMPAAGTAPRARWWLAIEQSGPWGAKALEQSRLDPAIGRALTKLAGDTGGKVLLIRRPGRHPEASGPRRVFASNVEAGWLLEATVDDVADLASIPPAAYIAPTPEQLMQTGLPWRSADPVALVCAHSQRDLCCALKGRPVAQEGSLQATGQVWECSHLGGHRFAATGVILPSGQVFARWSASALERALMAAQAGRLDVVDAMHLRGRSLLSPAEQVADVLVRERWGLDAPDALAFAQVAAGRIRVTTQQGTIDVDVEVTRGEGGPVSCGEPPTSSTQYRGRIVDGSQIFS